MCIISWDKLKQTVTISGIRSAAYVRNSYASSLGRWIIDSELNIAYTSLKQKVRPFNDLCSSKQVIKLTVFIWSKPVEFMKE